MSSLSNIVMYVNDGDDFPIAAFQITTDAIRFMAVERAIHSGDKIYLMCNGCRVASEVETVEDFEAWYIAH